MRQSNDLTAKSSVACCRKNRQKLSIGLSLSSSSTMLARSTPSLSDTLRLWSPRNVTIKSPGDTVLPGGAQERLEVKG